MEAVAKIKNCPMSARKMRYIADIIRGKDAQKALDILAFTKNEAAEWLEKLLLSAVANWEYKLEGMTSAADHDLYIKELFVDEAGMLRRFRPAPQGRAQRIRKRRNHVTLIVENKIPLPPDLEQKAQHEPQEVDVVEVEELTED
ncbi:MAG TPA: 50S ribosomal protein L22 [Bacteroidetes bacterium]|nr:50S ribosomal protein L22 [Bacteroidota bacterium]